MKIRHKKDMDPDTHLPQAAGDKPEPAPSAGSLDPLLEKAASGDRMAFNLVVARYQSEIFRMIYYRIRVRMDAEDVAQEVFLQAYNQLGRLKDRSRFRPWLYRIAVNKVRDFHRKHRLRSLFGRFSNSDCGNEDPAEPEDGNSRDALEMVIRKDFWRRVKGFLDQLPGMEKEVFMLRFFDHLSIPEISGILKKSDSTIKTHLYRAVRKFKSEESVHELLREVSS